jgi:hypothetical protein
MALPLFLEAFLLLAFYSFIDIEGYPLVKRVGESNNRRKRGGTPFWGRLKLSDVRGFYPRALLEPDMNLSTHPAPIVQPRAARVASGQRATADVLIFAAPIDMPADCVLSVFCISVRPTKREYDQIAGRSRKRLINLILVLTGNMVLLHLFLNYMNDHLTFLPMGF